MIRRDIIIGGHYHICSDFHREQQVIDRIVSQLFLISKTFTWTPSP